MIVDEEADYAGTNSTTRPRNDHVGPGRLSGQEFSATQRSSEGAPHTDCAARGASAVSPWSPVRQGHFSFVATSGQERAQSRIGSRHAPIAKLT
jgi:hypothetical protein